MRENKGFSLFEFMLIMVLILIILVIIIPIILYAINNARINAFKDSAYNVIEAAKYYATTETIPKEGIDVSILSNLDNNNFDSGIIKLENNNFIIVNLKKNNYCATGTIENMKVTNKGCSYLDKTKPYDLYLHIQEANSNSIKAIAYAKDEETDKLYYEFSIDGKQYTKKSLDNTYNFSNVKQGKNTIKVRITNDAKLSATYKNTYYVKEITNIRCKEQDSKQYVQKEKNIVCKYPSGYTYQYSKDNINYETIELNNDTYTFKFNEKGIIYTRMLKNNKVVATNTINISNIDNTLNGAYPELLDNMIPVIYDEKKNAWVKASSNTIYWDYDNKIWANAVLVNRNSNPSNPNSHSREYYLSSKADLGIIDENDIIGYYVWIPRYNYTLFNTTNKKIEFTLIDVHFENNDNTLMGTKNGERYTHKAFLYNNSNGFWVSKYQNSSDVNQNIYSLPNKEKITNISIGEASLLAENMNKKNNIYGLNNSIPHVLTNLEWGAITYLESSKYGQINNISTTANISGVYNMTGSFKEMIMANYNHDAGKDENDNSGFKNYGKIQWPSIIDYYNGITIKSRILGDATGETIGWSNNNELFVNGKEPFMARGGENIYDIFPITGSKKEDLTFRTVIIKSP